MENISESDNGSVNERKKGKGRSIVLTTVSGVVSAAAQPEITAEGQDVVILTILVNSSNYREMSVGLIGHDHHVQTLMDFSPGQKISATGSMTLHGNDYRLVIYSVRPEE